MTIHLSAAEARALTGEARQPRQPCAGCGHKVCTCLEDELVAQVALVGLPAPVRQFRAIPGRKFAWDLSWPDLGLLVDISGGIHLGTRGGHSSPAGLRRDAEKLNLAVIAGFRCLVVTGDQVRSGQALSWIEAALRRTG